MLAFQVSHEGSIPSTRTKNFKKGKFSRYTKYRKKEAIGQIEKKGLQLLCSFFTIDLPDGFLEFTLWTLDHTDAKFIHMITHQDLLDSGFFKKSNVQYLGQNAVFLRPIFSGVKWEEEWLYYRSRIESESGEILSLGFPKFFNLGERIKDEEILLQSIQNSTIKFYDKLDGSLVIRDEKNGIVNLRTRGSSSIGGINMDEENESDFGSKNAVEIMEISKNLGILNSGIAPEGFSFLWEYISPINKIIVNYDKPQMILIGAIRHLDLKVFPSDEAAKLLSVNVPHLNPIEMNLKTKNEIVEWVTKNFDEGVVAWCDNNLVKIKSFEYLRLFRAKYLYSQKDILLSAIEKNIFDPKELQIALEFPEETLVKIEEAISKWNDAISNVKEKKNLVTQYCLENSHLDRKTIAIEGVKTIGKDKMNLVFAYLDNKLPSSLWKEILKELDLGIQSKINQKEIDFIEKIFQ